MRNELRGSPLTATGCSAFERAPYRVNEVNASRLGLRRTPMAGTGDPAPVFPTLHDADAVEGEVGLWRQMHRRAYPALLIILHPIQTRTDGGVLNVTVTWAHFELPSERSQS